VKRANLTITSITPNKVRLPVEIRSPSPVKPSNKGCGFQLTERFADRWQSFLPRSAMFSARSRGWSCEPRYRFKRPQDDVDVARHADGGLKYICGDAPQNYMVVWVNTGEDKITRDETRAGCDPIHTKIPCGMAKSQRVRRQNEVVAFNTIIEACRMAAIHWDCKTFTSRLIL